MWQGQKPPITLRSSERGFALVVCLLLMTLLAILALGLSGLATIELRRASQTDQTALARANARLALMQAIGQLQKTLGPDQRVSASAEILGGNPKQPHWTGVWRSTQDDGSSFFKRNDLAGGLSDARTSLKTKPAERVMEWLVSGTGDPVAGSVADPVTLVNVDAGSKLEVPKVGLKNTYGDVAGHFAWWTGDLGVRANVGTRDPRHDVNIDKSNPQNGAWFRLMASQAADPSMMEGGATFKDDEILRLASTRTAGLTAAGDAWSKKHLFDFTVDSLGVLADVERGGLKRDLTAYFAGGGDVPPLKNLAGLKLDDPLVGDQTNVFNPLSRMRKAGPRFGLLRDWARLGIPFLGKNVTSRLPDMVEKDQAVGDTSKAFALANEQPVKLAGNVRAGLQPILVEATDFSHLSTFRVPNFAMTLYQLRFHHYPRVVLWNPYNVDLDFERSMVMIQGNGRQEMWTLNEKFSSTGQKSFSQSQWLSFEGGRSTIFNQLGKGIMDTDGYNDPYMGAYYFSIPKTRFGPGECLVFSPARQAEYDCESAYRPGAYNLNSNELSCTVAPDPSRSYFISGADIGGGTDFRPIKFWFAPTPAWSVNGRKGVENQSDDTRAVLKHIGTASTVSFADFDSAPQIAVVSASLQYGSGREPRISWSSAEQMPMEFLDAASPKSTVIPNVRTREGVRLRWFKEHPSNLINSGPLAKTAHFEDALLGNWNPRASFAIRSPWENIAGTLPQSGNLGGPWFFGAYTRDLYDQAVGWTEQTPVLSGGRYHGNPFGQPQEGAGRYVLFDVPRSETGVISLGQLQHAKISELIWHPSYAIGNSLPDPRLGTGGNKGLNRTAAVTGDSSSAVAGGFHENMLGWASDSERSSSKSEWANTSRAILGNLPTTDNLVYDLSFEANQTLWDKFYLSSGSPYEKSAFLSDPENQPLPNARMRLAPGARSPASEEGLKDFHKSASLLMVDGAFNVNSTRVEAWKALLASTRLSGYAGSTNVPFPRVLDSPDGAWRNGDSINAAAVWSGRRELTPGEIHQLAVAITNEVKLRGPFVSLADFVNRRLAEDETGRAGALQAAIEKAGLNSGMTSAFPLYNQTSLPNYTHPDNISDATRMEQTLKPASKAWGAPSWLTQADVLQALGPVLTARSDSFVVRAYGDATDSSGKVTARAWCEAVVQRTPAPLDPDESGLNPKFAGATGDFGRRFIIHSFRWLAPGEI